ncbi:MAG: LPXTG cell wall anchor domain-containing protein [Bacilli bacterium]|nr:LPXTG cell wall anchor domain-containing protein [Bacilli bacterium]
MINELIDVVSFAKKDAKTNNYLSGARLSIKDEKGNVVHEFTSTDQVYQVALDPGRYTLSEVIAPKGYLLSSEIVAFELVDDGTVRIRNNKGEYIDSAIITFYNTPETRDEVKVPATGKEATLLIIGGIALLIGGVACAKKTIKEC